MLLFLWFSKILFNLIGSSVVLFVFKFELLELTPKVPMDATFFLFNFKIWKKKFATEDFPLVPVTAIKFFGFLL